MEKASGGIGWVTRRVSGGISKLTELMGMEEVSERLKGSNGEDDKSNECGQSSKQGGHQDESGSMSPMSQLFDLPFFAPLVCRHSSDVTIVRLSSCNVALNCLLAPEVEHIRKKRKQNGQEGQLSKKGPDALQLLLYLTCACAKSCAYGTFRPLELYIIKIAFGPNGFLNDAVGYSSLGDIFEFVNDGEDWEGVVYF